MVSGDVAMLAIVSRGEERELVGPEGGISIHKSQHPDWTYPCEQYGINKVVNAWKDSKGACGLCPPQ